MTLRLRRVLEFLFVLAMGAYLALCIGIYNYQTSLMFFPSTLLRGTPASAGMDYQKLPLTAPDGTRLTGWKVWPRGQRPKRWVLFCHGNGGNISSELETCQLLTNLGLGVVVFDYRGYGESEGHLSRQADLMMDGQTYYDELHRQTSHIVLYGKSLGGGVASNLADRNPCEGLILQSTFTSLADRARLDYPILPVSLLCRFPLDVVGPASRIKVPKLIMHSPIDTVIPFRMGQAIFKNASEPKQWAELVGPHGSPDTVGLGKALQQFFSLLPPA